MTREIIYYRRFTGDHRPEWKRGQTVWGGRAHDRADRVISRHYDPEHGRTVVKLSQGVRSGARGQQVLDQFGGVQ